MTLMSLFGNVPGIPPPPPDKLPDTPLSCAEIDLQLVKLNDNRLRWLRGDLKAFDPAGARQRVDELLELRFWHAHAEDLATLSEWGDMGP